MELPKKEIEWSESIERYMKCIAEKAHGYSYLHKQSEACFARRRTLIELPTIVLSTVSGTLSIGSSNLFQDEQRAAQMIGALSLFISVLSTVGTYFSYSQRAEGHRLAHLQYSKLFRFLQIELGLPREERIGASDLLRITRETYERLAEISPLIPGKFINRFKKRFRNYDVSFPTEANGLESVSIYASQAVVKEERERAESPPASDSLPRSGTVDEFLAAEV